MGRHAGSRRRPRAPRAALPWELLGWGAFACVVAVAAVLWYGGSWGTVALVVGAAVLGLGGLAVMATRGASRPPRRPPP